LGGGIVLVIRENIVEFEFFAALFSVRYLFVEGAEPGVALDLRAGSISSCNRYPAWGDMCIPFVEG
jgi:hypothetical protein